MANSNGIISGSVRQIVDVKTVLGESVNTLSGLCKSTKINAFAKYKPVRFTGTRSTTWWKAFDGDCGFTPYKLTKGYADVINHCDGTLNGWVYNKPNGSTYPYRLLDFQGYNHNVSVVANMFIVTPPQVGTGSSDEIVLRLLNPSGTNALLWQNIDTIKNCYFGIYAKKDGSTVGRRVTATGTLAGGGGEGSGDMFSVSTYQWSTGTYKVYPFISEDYMSISGADAVGSFWTIPYTSPITLTVSSGLTAVTIKTYSVDTSTALYRLNGYTGYKVTAVVTIRNARTSSITLSNNTGFTRFIGSSISDALVAGEATWSLSSVTVSANASKNVTITGVITVDAYESGANLWIRYSNSSLTLTDSVRIDSGIPQ